MEDRSRRSSEQLGSDKNLSITFCLSSLAGGPAPSGHCLSVHTIVGLVYVPGFPRWLKKKKKKRMRGRLEAGSDLQGGSVHDPPGRSLVGTWATRRVVDHSAPPWEEYMVVNNCTQYTVLSQERDVIQLVGMR